MQWETVLKLSVVAGGCVLAYLIYREIFGSGGSEGGGGGMGSFFGPLGIGSPLGMFSGGASLFRSGLSGKLF